MTSFTVVLVEEIFSELVGVYESGNGKCSVEKESREKDREREMGEGLRVHREDLWWDAI